jgi:hypothetical protein
VKELLLFVCAVVAGTVAGVASQQVLVRLVASQTAVNMALAIATTCTGAAHSRLVHQRSMGELIPHVVAGAPVAYAAMRAIHLILGL